MFHPKTDKIAHVASFFPQRMSDLETIFGTRVAVYIDYANIYHWRKKLGWQFDIRRMKQFLDSFDSIEKTYFYQ